MSDVILSAPEIKILEDARNSSRALCWILHTHHIFSFVQFKAFCQDQHNKQMAILQAHLDESPLANMKSDPAFIPDFTKQHSIPLQAVTVDSPAGRMRAGFAADKIFVEQLTKMVQTFGFSKERLKIAGLKSTDRISEKLAKKRKQANNAFSSDNGKKIETTNSNVLNEEIYDVSDVNRASLLCETREDFYIVLTNLQKFFKVFQYENKFNNLNVPPCLFFKIALFENSIEDGSEVDIFIRDIKDWTMELQVMTKFTYLFGQETHGMYEVRRREIDNQPKHCSFPFCGHASVIWRQPISPGFVLGADHPLKVLMAHRSRPSDDFLRMLFEQAKGFKASKDDLLSPEPFQKYIHQEQNVFPAWCFRFGCWIVAGFLAFVSYKLCLAVDMLNCVKWETQFQETLFRTRCIPFSLERQAALTSMQKLHQLHSRQTQRAEDWKMYSKWYVLNGRFRVLGLAFMLSVPRFMIVMLARRKGS